MVWKVWAQMEKGTITLGTRSTGSQISAISRSLRATEFPLRSRFRSEKNWDPENSKNSKKLGHAVGYKNKNWKEGG